ncbi:beta-glucanase [Streptococcus caballi]|uniref:beta-glucanase n=1 Tax=Streptococcus caballi TaxID=439220 RepID=UPI0003626D27|nr:glycoside hydrolase family 16 protein [Streptococcus caballi]
MMKKWLLLVTLVALTTITTQKVSTQTMHNIKTTHFGTGFEHYDASYMELRTGSNGEMFNCQWKPDNVAFHNDVMILKIDSDGRGGYTGGEWRTRDYFGYGLYQVRMKPIKNTGVVSSFFTYTGPSDGTKWDEIDIEFLGKNTTQVQFNYFTDGVGNHEKLYDLGFDATADFHTYGFEWQPDHITWLVDGRAVYTAYDNIPSTPGKIMMNTWPGIGVDNWLAPYDGKTPLYGYYDWISYDPF